MNNSKQNMSNRIGQSGAISATSKNGKVTVYATKDAILNASLLAHLVDALLRQGTNREFILAAVQAGLDAVA
ncbi:hypothetical protein [Ethanoligenens sp.]|uniref:hypothetical protein n=1 Tax=Ethanoligenens sp. TaxID=2099655 RepID=UPI0039EB1B17